MKPGVGTRGGATWAVLIPMCLMACTGPEPAPWLEEPVPEPRVFAPGVISSGLREYGITFTPDGREAYFTRRARRGPAQIFVSRWEGDGWSEPTLADFAAEGDEGAFITPDGSTLVFSSRRPLRGTADRSDNLWVARRGEAGWSEPEPLPGTVNQPRSEIDDFTTGAELGPELLPGGALLYWTRVSPDWGSDIYVAEPTGDGSYSDPRPLRLNSVGDETNPTLSPDGRFLLFQGYRDGRGYGDQELYVARRNPHGWDAPVLLPEPFNSAGYDGDPGFSPDGRFFFFSTDREARGGYPDIWYVDRSALDLDRITGGS